ncbi:MAG: hypothetical protein H0W15_08845 [Gemmatimonadales bacterium]|nr:hypothetical protein [Gemmatimonadales bacterium]
MSAPIWVRRLRGAVGMGLLWGAAWAIIGGGIMEGIIDAQGRVVDMWPQLLGVVGFLGGIVFAAMLWIAGGRRSFSEFSFREFAGLGALAGALQGVLAMLLVGAPLLFVGVTMIATMLAATGSLAVARMGGSRTTLASSRDARRQSLSRRAG